MRKILIAAALATSVLAAPAVAQSVAETPLIPRAKLFGNPASVDAKISPDGRWIAWRAPSNGIVNVWVAPLGRMNQARAVTTEKVRPIQNLFWAPDSSKLYYLADKNGDENELLYAADPRTGATTTITPFTKTRVFLAGSSPLVRDRFLISVNNRDPRFHDLYSVDVRTGALTKVMQNDGGYVGYWMDERLTPRVAMRNTADGEPQYFMISNGVVADKPFETVPFTDTLTTQLRSVTSDGTQYWNDSRQGNTAGLYAVKDGKRTLIAQDARADLGDIGFDGRTNRPTYYVVNYLKPEHRALDNRYARDFDRLRARFGNAFEVLSSDDAERFWTVRADPVTASPAEYVYDRRTGGFAKLFDIRPELSGQPLSPMHAVEIRARDGLVLPSYLTLPKGSDADGNGVPDKPLPMVLLVHGGPWARDTYGFSRTDHWLANRGYAVLSVNYRGSTGFGKNFVNAGDLQWGRKMHDDLLDAVGWAVTKGVASRDKVAIYGGSYGGYATLAGLTFTPETFACGVDIVGPSNLFTLLETVPPYWKPLIQQFHRRMGDPTTEAGRALLKERSPLTFVDRIKRPLLIGQGATDPRVNIRESDQIVAAMQAKNIPVTYVVFPDEGHGFARPVNNTAFNAVAENFLKTCLGGRAEPVGGDLKPSTAQIRAGAGYVEGLADAMAK